MGTQLRALFIITILFQYAVHDFGVALQEMFPFFPNKASEAFSSCAISA